MLVIIIFSVKLCPAVVLTSDMPVFCILFKFKIVFIMKNISCFLIDFYLYWLGLNNITNIYNSCYPTQGLFLPFPLLLRGKRDVKVHPSL